MKVAMIAFGTRGDVQPAVALGKALKAEGHDVRILAGNNFKPWIERHGLNLVASRIDIQAVMESDLGRQWIEKGHNPIAEMRVIKKLTDQTAWEGMNDAWQCCRDAQVIFSSFTSDIYARSIAEKTGAIHISVPLQPVLVPTRIGAATMNGPAPNRKSILNYLFGKALLEPANWRFQGEMVNRFRSEVLSLPQQTRGKYLAAKRRVLTLQAYSKYVVPHADDWPSTIHTTGYLFLDEPENWSPPAGLSTFLESGEPPVCIGFGSMIGHNLDEVSRVVIAAIRESGRRAILLSGWAGIGDADLGDRIFRIDAAPHEWLFPRVSAVVHHGGAGTTAAGLRVGLPTVIVPHLGDQPFWGRRVRALGAGPKPIKRNKLTSSALAGAIIEATSNQEMRKRAQAIGAGIRSEDGIGTAIEIINNYLSESTGHVLRS